MPVDEEKRRETRTKVTLRIRNDVAEMLDSAASAKDESRTAFLERIIEREFRRGLKS